MRCDRWQAMAIGLILLVGCGGNGSGAGPASSPVPAGPPLPEFLWGTATAAHQVEGYNTRNDWYLWEMMPGKITNGDVSGVADDHYHLFDQDLAMAEQMKHNAYRFSIEWSRIEAARDRYDAAEIAHYHDMLASVRRHGLVPVVTLHHFTNPQWVMNPLRPDTDLDGWLSNDTVEEFVEFAADMAAEFGREVDLWITINEPLVIVNGTYFEGGYPSDKGPYQFEDGRKAVFQLLRAHAEAYHRMHDLDVWDADCDGRPCLVTSAKHIRVMAPKKAARQADVDGARQADYVFNRLFFDVLIDGQVDADMDGKYTTPGTDPAEGFHPELARTLDYLAVNYYSRSVVTGLAFIPYVHGLPEENSDPNVEHNDMGWEIYPQGFHDTLAWLGGYGLPIIVTENGIPDADDDQRPSFLVRHLDALFQARNEGADIRGYLHWTLLDNFEWTDGFWPRFGLLDVNYDTLERTARPSTALFTQIIEAGGITDEIRRTAGLE